MIRWVDAFLDRPAGSLTSAVTFWSAVTGSTPEPQADPRFVRLHTARPGDDWLEIQEVGEGPGGHHPDLWVDDLPAFTARARDAGARVTIDHGTYLTFTSPAGQPFCAAPWRGEQQTHPVPYTAPNGVTLRPHQICFDLAPSDFEGEVAFWSAITGWHRAGEGTPFHRLQPEPPIPIRFLLQRLDDDRPASAHLDVSCADRPAGRTWHESLGATLIGVWPYWTTMRDPAGGVYCLTEGDPYED